MKKFNPWTLCLMTFGMFMMMIAPTMENHSLSFVFSGLTFILLSILINLLMSRKKGK